MLECQGDVNILLLADSVINSAYNQLVLCTGPEVN